MNNDVSGPETNKLLGDEMIDVADTVLWIFFYRYIRIDLIFVDSLIRM